MPLPVGCLLMFLTSLDCKILQIWSIVLSPAFRKLVVIVSKSLYYESRAITIAIIFQRSCLGVITVQKHLQRYFTSANICITGLLYPFGLIIFGQQSNSCKIEYTTPWPTLVQILLSLSYIFFKSFRSMMLKAI